MKSRKLLVICLIMLLTIASCIFSSCGANLAASAGGVYNSETSDTQDAEAQKEGEDITLDAEALNVPDADAREYVLNTNTKKFHYPDCKSVDKMKDKNKLVEETTREDIIARGYDPCKNCNP